MIKKTILIILAFANVVSLSFAADRKWTTQEVLPSGDKIIMYWTGVYEGRDTVYQINIGSELIALGKNDAAGQPVLNLEHNLIALPYCADDGCKSRVNILDLSKKKLLSPVELNYKGQIYIGCHWTGTTLEIQVDHDLNKHSTKSIHKYNITSCGAVPL